MTFVLRTASQYWHHLFTDSVDERSKGWFMVGSPFPVVILLIAYYRFVKITGPELMKNRKPFNLDKIIQIYNIFQILICGWMAIEGFRVSYGSGYDWTCQPMDRSLSPSAVAVATMSWGYYMLKLIDLIDTVFFVLRKKFNQVTVLHVYHHIGVAVLGYIGTKYYPDGHGFLLLPLNCFVHTIMYAYYFITNYNPEYRKKLWWKKYITQIQIVQFFILSVHMGKLFFLTNCEYPLMPSFLFLPQNTLLTVLFINFYIKTYITPNKPVKSS